MGERPRKSESPSREKAADHPSPEALSANWQKAGTRNRGAIQMANESDSERPMNQQFTAVRPGEQYILTARRCHKCGTLALRTENYCPCCGESLRPTCQHCGSVIPHAIAFYCPQCGGDLKNSTDSP